MPYALLSLQFSAKIKASSFKSKSSNASKDLRYCANCLKKSDPTQDASHHHKHKKSNSLQKGGHSKHKRSDSDKKGSKDIQEKWKEDEKKTEFREKLKAGKEGHPLIKLYEDLQAKKISLDSAITKFEYLVTSIADSVDASDPFELDQSQIAEEARFSSLVEATEAILFSSTFYADVYKVSGYCSRLLLICGPIRPWVAPLIPFKPSSLL